MLAAFKNAIMHHGTRTLSKGINQQSEIPSQFERFAQCRLQIRNRRVRGQLGRVAHVAINVYDVACCVLYSNMARVYVLWYRSSHRSRLIAIPPLSKKPSFKVTFRSRKLLCTALHAPRSQLGQTCIRSQDYKMAAMLSRLLRRTPVTRSGSASCRA